MKNKLFRIMAVVLIVAMMTVGFAGCKKSQCYYCEETKQCRTYEDDILGEITLCKDCREKLTAKDEDSEGDSKGDSKGELQKSQCYYCGEMQLCEMYEDDILGELSLCKECRKTFSSMSESPKDYFQYVLKKSSYDVAEKFAKGYGMAVKSLLGADDMSSDAEFSVTVGKNVRDMLEEEIGIELDWMEKISLLVNSDITKSAHKFDLGLAFCDERLIRLIMLANTPDKMAYLQIPELNDTYLGLDLETVFDDITEVTEVFGMLSDSLPEEAKAEELLKRYFDLAISCVEDVEQDKEEVTVGEISTKLTVLEATINEGTVKAMLEAVIKELKKDRDVKEIIYDVTEVLCEASEVEDETDADEVYDEFIDALTDLENELDDLDDVDLEIVLKLYVDKEGRLAGWTAELEDENMAISSLMITKGNTFAYELEGKVDGEKIVLEGTGELTSSEMNGDFKLKYIGLEILNFTLEDVKVKEMKDGYFNGKIRISLGKAMINAIEDEMGYELKYIPFDIADLVLELIGKNSKDELNIAISLYDLNDLVGAVTLVNKIGKAERITFPNDTEVVMIEDEEALMDWAEGIDIDNFIDKLENILGDDISELIEEYLYGGHNDEYYDYDYDDYYDYDDWY